MVSVRRARPSLEVLLDVAALVLDVQTGQHAVGDDPRREPARRRGDDLAVEQQLNPIRSAQVEVLADDLLEQLPPALGLVEHLGAADLQLQDREGIPEAGRGVRPGQRQRQDPQPAIEAGLDIIGAQPVADRLQGGRVGAALEAVVERGERDTGPGQLPLGPLMAVQAQLQGVRGVPTALQEAGTPLLVDEVDEERATYTEVRR